MITLPNTVSPKFFRESAQVTHIGTLAARYCLCLNLTYKHINAIQQNVKIKFISLKRSLALLMALYLAGCATSYTTTGGIAKRDIAPFKGTAYFNKSQDLTLFDKEGGLEVELGSDWEKLSNANLSEYASNPRLNAEEVVTRNRETKETTQEGIIFYKGHDGNKYELSSSNGKFKVTIKPEISGGGGGGSGGGGSGGGGCFTPETPVLMSDGSTKPIKNIQIGDSVKSFDFQSNKPADNKVIALFKFKKTEYLLINGLEVTPTHPFCVGRGEWKEAGMLKVGDVLIGEGNKKIKIEGIERVKKNVTVHNFTVDGTHNYFVSNGKDNFLVHNKGGGGGG